MVKTVLSTARQGTRDWIIQRLSALYMGVYAIVLVAYLVSLPSVNYYDWRGLFAGTGMKIATVLFVISLLFHAWVGMWTVFTDYVKPAMVRVVLETLVFLMLIACFFWALLILWSV